MIFGEQTGLESIIERGEHHRHVFEMLRPGIDLARERELRKDAGQSDAFRPEELYDDVIPCFQQLHAAGYRIGVAGNHEAEFVKSLRDINLSLDFIGSSEEWRVEKPSLGFSSRIVEVSGVAPGEIAHVRRPR